MVKLINGKKPKGYTGIRPLYRQEVGITDGRTRWDEKLIR